MKKIYGAILDEGEEFYTYMRKMFYAIDNKQKEYNWLISDCECACEVEKFLSQDHCFISGDELTQIVEKNDFQWIWAVLSGFKKDIPIDEIMKYPLPYANGYKGFWQNPLSLQHPLASVEIVPWDSSLTLVLSENRDIIDLYRRAFPLSKDLSKYNEDLI